MTSPLCTIIGCGPAGLMAAETLANAGIRVSLYDRMPSPARKFLMAGAQGGLNLTNSEPLDSFLLRYKEASSFLEPAIQEFPPQKLRQWCEDLGEPTFEGNGGKIFPKAMKASPLLAAWLKRLKEKNVTFTFNHRWTGWNDKNELTFLGPDEKIHTNKPDAVLLALGGASWSHLGSDGLWTTLLKEKNIAIAPWKPANCGFNVPFSPSFSERFTGKQLKPVALSFKEKSARGEIIFTQKGLEGSPVYALSSVLRDVLETQEQAILTLDLHPDIPFDKLIQKLTAPRGSQSLSTFLRKTCGLSPQAIGLIQEGAHKNNLSLKTPKEIASAIKTLPLHLTSTGPLERAISSAGGICLNNIDKNYMLRTIPSVFVAGEMLNWEAPTGGYLLQATFSTAVAAAEGIKNMLTP